MALILSPTPAHLERCAAALRQGQVVAIPSETVYGLAASALHEEACRDIFRIKGRPLVDPLIVHVAQDAPLDRYADLPPVLEVLRERFWPGPVSFILPKKPLIPDLITAGLPSVALRCPSHPVLQDLLRRTGLPLAAPSANPFGYISPTTAGHVADSLGNRVDLILDGGPCPVGLESTILDLCHPEKGLILRRPGLLDPAEIEAVTGLPVLLPPVEETAQDAAPQIAPGSLTRHYSPRTSLTLHDTLGTVKPDGPPTGFLFYQFPGAARIEELEAGGHRVGWLTRNNDPEEAARQLYAVLREMDAANLSLIRAEWVPSSRLAPTLNDRLRRAAALPGGEQSVS